MIAVSERIHGHGAEPDRLVWHKPIGRVVEEFQAIACSSNEGITFPGGRREVPVKLDLPNESWCVECLAVPAKDKG